MLNSLSIKNFALIEDITLSLDDDLTIITGETGAGKSILLGALSLLLGKRADLSSSKNPEKKCIIEGGFSIAAYNLKPIFLEHDLDYEPQTIIRRELLPSGKSRAFVNDTPVKLQQLTVLGRELVDIHSQHETLFVGDSSYQYHVIDALADNAKLRSDFETALKTYKGLQHQLAELQARQREAQKTYDYHLFLLNELREANLEPEMQEELEERYQQLSNVEELKENLSVSLQQLQNDDLGIIDLLQEVKNRLASLETYGKSYEGLSQRLKSVLLEVEDMAVEIERLFDTSEDDPGALEIVNEKLQKLYTLQKKHSVSTVSELLDLQTELEEKVSTSDKAAETTAELEKQIKTAKENAQNLANGLSDRRKKIIPEFTKSVENVLEKLGMPDAQLKIDLKKNEGFNLHGSDEMTWQLSANQGGRFQDIKKSASGGELSRITLAIKSILANFSNLPTIIFDEIDTGVSGEIAQKMGDIMGEMGKKMQVVSITHLPQIAAKGQQHFKVFKETQKNTAQTTILKLDKGQRISELAEMLGGKEKLDSAIAHAKALLN